MQWTVEEYPSGSVVVISRDAADPQPWLDIHAGLAVEPPDEEGDYPQNQAVCRSMAREVAAYLNGGSRPSWLSDMRRVSEKKLVGADGGEVVAIGPTEKDEASPMGWSFREDHAARDMRARLIDRISLA